MIKKKINKPDNINENVNLYGKVAVFPKNVKPSKAYKFLENIKMNPEKLWYMLIQQQEDNLQMIKYNIKADIYLREFVNSLKSYYLEQIQENVDLYQQIDKIVIESDENDLLKNMVRKVEILTLERLVETLEKRQPLLFR
jgi:chaperonin cofactor prefoldin